MTSMTRARMAAMLARGVLAVAQAQAPAGRTPIDDLPPAEPINWRVQKLVP